VLAVFKKRDRAMQIFATTALFKLPAIERYRVWSTCGDFSDIACHFISKITESVAGVAKLQVASTKPNSGESGNSKMKLDKSLDNTF